MNGQTLLGIFGAWGVAITVITAVAALLRMDSVLREETKERISRLLTESHPGGWIQTTNGAFLYIFDRLYRGHESPLQEGIWVALLCVPWMLISIHVGNTIAGSNISTPQLLLLAISVAFILGATGHDTSKGSDSGIEYSLRTTFSQFGIGTIFLGTVIVITTAIVSDVVIPSPFGTVRFGLIFTIGIGIIVIVGGIAMVVVGFSTSVVFYLFVISALLLRLLYPLVRLAQKPINVQDDRWWAWRSP